MLTKVLKYLIGTALILSFSECRKAKLRGEYSVLEGEWIWSRGWGDAGTRELKLDLKERGKYKLFRGKKKIEFGKIIKTDTYLKFVSGNINPLTNKNQMLDNKMITFFSNDSINITRTDCADCAFSTFRKN
jgi:hypothetical protein